jgi:hypothetical protein
VKFTLIGVASLIALIFLYPATLGLRDNYAEKRLNALVEAELPPDATTAQMESFLEQHTEEYWVDDNLEFWYGGQVAIPIFDAVFDRRVMIVLYYDPNSLTMTNHEVIISYTFL